MNTKFGHLKIILWKGGLLAFALDFVQCELSLSNVTHPKAAKKVKLFGMFNVTCYSKLLCKLVREARQISVWRCGLYGYYVLK